MVMLAMKLPVFGRSRAFRAAYYVAVIALVSTTFGLLRQVDAAYAVTASDPNYAVRIFARHFACCNGPLGIAFDSFDHLYAADNANGRLYKFGWNGGFASKPLNKAPIRGGIDGLAFGRDRKLYLARYDLGDVIRINPRNGKILRVVATGIRCAGGLAVDPLSGDLFVSQPGCTNNILRISHPGRCIGSCTATIYVSVGGTDGITFASDGTLYSQTNGCAYRISPTNVSPTTANLIACPRNKMDGIALSLTTIPGQPLLFANGNDGTIVKIDEGTIPPAVTRIVRGGTRGDFVTVGPDGCLYATQSRTIEKVSDASGNCSWTPTGVIPQIRVSPDIGPSALVGTSVSFTATLTNVAFPTPARITFTTRGAFSEKRTVVANAQGAATVAITGVTTGRVIVVATATEGKLHVTSNPGIARWVR
jgi:sugar lactone lactonase YvrE